MASGSVELVDELVHQRATRPASPADGVAALREQGWSLAQQVWAERLVPVVHEGAVVGVAFHAGYRSGGYPAYVGMDESGQQVALAVDLRVLAP